MAETIIDLSEMAMDMMTIMFYVEDRQKNNKTVLWYC